MTLARRVVSALLLVSALVAAGPVVSAQPVQGQSVILSQDAKDVRTELMAVLKRYPPALGRVLKLDAALLGNDAYLAPYPALTAFLKQHPDIARNPAYYLEPVEFNYYPSYRSEGARMAEDIMTGVAIFVVMVAMLGFFTWIVRTLIDYRRWHRLSRVQAETHTKLLS